MKFSRFERMHALEGAYVYTVLVDGVCRYIGKGRGGRMDVHVKVARRIVRRRAKGERVGTTLFYNNIKKKSEKVQKACQANALLAAAARRSKPNPDQLNFGF